MPDCRSFEYCTLRYQNMHDDDLVLGLSVECVEGRREAECDGTSFVKHPPSEIRWSGYHQADELAAKGTASETRREQAGSKCHEIQGLKPPPNR